LSFGQVVANLVEVDIFKILVGPLGRHRFLLEDFECLEAEVEDPWIFAFDFGDVFDGVLSEAHTSIELVVFRILKVSLLGVDVDGFVLNFCICIRHIK
jgi:hypothetical protein